MSEAEEEFQALVCAVEDASDEDMYVAEGKLCDFILSEQDLIIRALRRDTAIADCVRQLSRSATRGAAMIDDRTTASGEIITPSRCPFCGYHGDAASCLSDPTLRPQAGDVTVCIDCARINVFNADFTLRTITDEEYTELSIDTQNELYKTILAIRSLNDERKRGGGSG